MSNRRCCTGVIYEVLSTVVDSPADFRNPRDCSKLQVKICSVIILDNFTFIKGFNVSVQDIYSESSLMYLLGKNDRKEWVLSLDCNVTHEIKIFWLISLM